MREKLTVLIPCKDEQKNIGACIEAARAVADEILVADSGSSDATMDIVRQSGGCRLIQRQFVNYSDFKNWAIPQAANPWVLIVDADERVTPALADEIHQVLNGPPADLDGYWIYRRNFFMGHEIKHGGWNTDKVFRLIRRDSCRYRDCRVHEEITVAPQRAGKLKQRLVHFTYWSYDQYFEKYLRYTKWGAQDMWDAGQRTGPMNLLGRPVLRFLQLYILRGGFLDGMAGIQVCMLQAFFVSMVKQARLWERQHARAQADIDVPPSGTPNAQASQQQSENTQQPRRRQKPSSRKSAA